MALIQLNIDLVDEKVSCSLCGRNTAHASLASVRESDSQGNKYNSFDWTVVHQLVQCKGCETISYRSSTNSEDHDWDEDGNGYYITTEKLYPPRLAKQSIEEKDTYFLPHQTRELLKETHAALANSQPILAGVGIRGLIETVAKDRKAKGNLYQQIENLVAQQLLTPSSARTLHHLRALGNDAAHEAEPHTTAQLSLAIEIIEHVLQEVYILPKKVDKVFRDEALPITPTPVLPPPPGSTE